MKTYKIANDWRQFVEAKTARSAALVMAHNAREHASINPSHPGIAAQNYQIADILFSRARDILHREINYRPNFNQWWEI